MINYNVLYYENQRVLYAEVNPKEYDIKLVASPEGGAKHSISELYNMNSTSHLAINGGLFYNSESAVVYDGGCIDSEGHLYGSFSTNYPTFYFKNGELVIDANINNNAAIINLKPDFARSCAFYSLPDSSYTPPSVDRTSNRSMIGIKENGNLVFIVTNPLAYDQQIALLQTLGCTRGVNLDGGGSSSMVVEGTVVKDTAIEPTTLTHRKIADAILVTDYMKGLYLKAKNTRFVVRDKVVNGNILETVYPGSRAAILDIVDGIQSDGYQWAKVKYNNKIGYAQLDTSYDYLIENDSTFSPLYLKAELLTFRVRSSKVNGSTYSIVPVGGRAEIIGFDTLHASDNYQWVRVRYNSYVGWAQLDLQAYTLVKG